MYKLLTEEARIRVRHEYLLRRAVVMVVALIVVLAVAMIGLFPSYTLSKTRQKQMLEDPLFSSFSQQSEALELEAWLTGLNEKLRLLSPELDRIRPSTDLTQVIKEKGTGVRLIKLEWVEKENTIELSVSGVAQDRQALLSFEKRLNSSGHFSQVTLPVSNLAKEREIPFELRLSPIKMP